MAKSKKAKLANALAELKAQGIKEVQFRPQIPIRARASRSKKGGTMANKTQFNPDKDADHCGNTNGQRAERAEDALAYYKLYALIESGDPVEHDTIVDLLTDVAHLCDRAGLDFDQVASMARLHWQEER